MAGDVLYRATPELHVREDSSGGRTVYGVVVPYGVAAEVNDGRGPYQERFAAGAFARSIADRSAKIRLFINHDTLRRLPIGRATELVERSDGLYGAFVVSATRDGDEALTLVRDGVVDSFSVGFKPLRERSVAGVVERTEAALREVSLVAMPAYAGALVGGVRLCPTSHRRRPSAARPAPKGIRPVSMTPLPQHNSPAYFIEARKRLLAEADALTLNRTDDLTGADLERFEEIARQLEYLASSEATVTRLRSLVANGAATLERGADGMDDDDNGRTFNVNRQTPDPWTTDTRALAPGDVRNRALAAVEKAPSVPDAARQRFSVELERATGEHFDRLSAWTVATSNPDYLRSFFKLAADPENGHREWTGPELEAFRTVRNLSRAMSLTDAAGGYLVPFQLDPTVILTNAGGTNPVREVARVVTATSDVWNGVSSAGITASWDAEAAEVSDDAPTLAQPAVPVHKMSAFVPISIEAFEDAANVAAEIAAMLADSANVLEAEALQIGTGAGQPTGIVTALTGTASEVNRTGTTLDAGDFFAVQEALPARWQARASWIAHLVSINRGRSIIAGTGLTTPLVSDETDPPRVLGKPIREASFMDSTVSVVASDFLLVYGDFSNYVIADRIGTSVELVPHLFGANRRPTGQRGWYMHRRTGGDSVNDAAFRMLDKSD